MSDKAHGCSTDAIPIRRKAFLAIFTSIEHIFLNVKKLNFSHQAFMLHLVSPMKVKSCWTVEYNTPKYWLEKCHFNIVCYGTHIFEQILGYTV